MQKLRSLRKDRGLSQQGLANISGVPLRVIQSHEYGQRVVEHARLSTLVKLATALGCRFYDLLDDERLVEQIKRCI